MTTPTHSTPQALPPVIVPVLSPPLSPVPNMVADGARLIAIRIGLPEMQTILTRDYFTAHRVERGVPHGAVLRGLFVEAADAKNDIRNVRIWLVFEYGLCRPVTLNARIPEQPIQLQPYMPALTEMQQLVRAMTTRPTG